MTSTPHRTTPGHVQLSSSRALWVIVTLGFGSLASALMQSLVIPIQGELPELLNATPSTTSWVVTATLLGAAVSMPVTGRLADIIGKKPVLVASAVILIAGSLICALTSDPGIMIAGRVLQGIAMGYIPVAISLVRELAPAHMRNAAVAGVSATLGVGGALGLPLAAWLAQEFDWHMLFWVSAILAAIMLLTSALVIPHVVDSNGGRLDVVGAIGLTAGLVAVLVAVTKGNEWGWGSVTTLGLIVFGVIVLLAWGRYELRHSDPLVDLRTSARRPILFTNIAAVLIGFGMMAQAIVVPQLLEMPTVTGYGLGQSIMEAGLWMAPAGLAMMAFTPVSAKLLTRLGGRLTLSIGAFVIAGGYVVAVFLMNAPWQLMLASCVASAGVGIGYAAMPTLILSNVPAHEAASSVGVNSLMRSMGTTIAGAVMAVVLTSNTASVGGGVPGIPTQSAFQLCFFIGACAAAAGALVVLLIPRQRGGDATGQLESPAAQESVADGQVSVDV